MASRAWYALRRTLPVWSFEENLKELVEKLPEYRVDELIVKVDTEEFSHGQPVLSWIEDYQEKLFLIKKAMDRLGIYFSINPWITLGHNDRGRNSLKELPGLGTMVGHDGVQCISCACPLSDAWRSNTAAVWRLYAETGPHVIWVEDDFRTFNHRPVNYGCFCPEHLDRFSNRIGERVTREELVSAVLAPGKPHRWREEFLQFQGDIMIETAGFLARTVHEVSPEIRIGLMSSGPRRHCLEGRRWSEFIAVLADGTEPYSRPPLGNYSEASLRGLYNSHDAIKLTRHCLPANTTEQTEVENFPFTRYSKSAVFTFVQTALSFAYGSQGVTFNLFDHCGTPMEASPAFGQLLGDKKEFLNSLASRASEPGVYRGIRLLFDEREAFHKELREGESFEALGGAGSSMMTALETHGIPTTYDESPVTATTGQQLRAFSDGEIRSLLKHGLLLDAVAAGVLMERGFGKEIGLEAMAEPVHLDSLGALSAEELVHPEFGGPPGGTVKRKFLTLTIPNLSGRPIFSIVQLVEDAVVLSRTVDPDGRRTHTCLYAYENGLGGRIAVMAYDFDSAYGVSYNHPIRAEQLRKLMRWLARSRLPIMVKGGVYPLAFRKDCPGRVLLGLFNLSLDPWPGAEFRLADIPDGLTLSAVSPEVLTSEGVWKTSSRTEISGDGNGLNLVHRGPVAFDEPLFLSLEF